MKQINEMIRELREDRDLKQSDVAKVLGIVQQTYSNYETGLYDLPLRHLMALSDYYHVSSDYILGNTAYNGTADSLNGNFTSTVSIGEFLSDAISLDKSNRHALHQILFRNEHTKRFCPSNICIMILC